MATKFKNGLAVDGNLNLQYRSVSASAYTIGTTNLVDHILEFTATSTVTLPSASSAGSGRTYHIKNNSTGVITINAASGETIDGLSSYIISIRYQSVTIVSNGISGTGAGWIIV